MTDDLPKRYTWLELVEMSLTMTEDFVRARHEAENHLAERYHESFEKALEDVEAVFKRTEALRSLSSESGQELLISGYLQTLRNMCRPISRIYPIPVQCRRVNFPTPGSANLRSAILSEI